MTPRLTFRPAARAEVREARRWYDGQRAGLGREFLADLDEMAAAALQYPRMYAEASTDGAVRRALLRRFPYAVFYEILEGGALVVLACRHVRQDEFDLTTRRA